MTPKFTGKVSHTEDTIRLLFRTQYFTYEKRWLFLRIAVGVVLIALAVMGDVPMVAKALLLMLGCWLVISRDFFSAMRADRAVEERRGKLPVNVCSFYDDHMQLSGEGSMDIRYKQFQRLIEDDQYLYLFLDRKTACMVEKTTVSPKSAEELKTFVEGKTGLSWRRNKSLLTLTAKDLIQMIRDRRQGR